MIIVAAAAISTKSVWYTYSYYLGYVFGKWSAVFCLPYLPFVHLSLIGGFYLV